MADETIIAVFDTTAAAEAAVRDLEAAGVPSTAISRHQRDDVTTAAGTTAPRERGFWSSLFGSDDDTDTTVYDRSIESGGSVVSVRAPEAHATRVMEILERHNPVDLDDRAASYGLARTPMAAAAQTASTTPSVAGAAGTAVGTTTTGETDQLALAEEQLTVGKRAVNRGTTRIHRFVVETPVEESVTLRDETVSIERRPVEAGRAVTNADFTDRVIEVAETGEEAVVGKTARVREEVVINKAATERVETVRDTVRHEDVRIEKDGKPAREAEVTTGRRAGI